MSYFNRHNLTAAAIHLAISALIALLSLGLVYGVWYPAPLAAALGVGDIFLLMLGIDIVLGPLMTLVVYKPHKSSLKFDLTVIVCLQLAALAYGLNTVASGRPAYMVFTKDRFDLVLAYEVPDIVGTPERPALAMQSHWAQPLWGYQLKSAILPTDPKSYPVLTLLMSSALAGGPDVPNVPAFHSNYTQALPRLLAAAQPLAAALQAQYPAGSVAVPLKIKFTIYTVVLNPSTGMVLGIEPVDVF